MGSFSRRFKQLRDEKGWTQEVAAEKLGVSRPTIAGYESEIKSRIPRKDTLQKIAEAFDVTIDYLLGNTNVTKRDDSVIRESMEAYQKLSVEKKKIVDDVIKGLSD
jgi:transcriptional regulator with XRE-family HTH domain